MASIGSGTGSTIKEGDLVDSSTIDIEKGERANTSTNKRGQWVDKIYNAFKKRQTEKCPYTPVCIFPVPNSISNVMPEAYSPQLLGLGPYHYFSHDLYKMERDKINMAMTAIDEFKLPQYKYLVNELLKRATEIRACYFGGLDVKKDKTLAMIMAIDCLFLLELLRTHAKLKEKTPQLPPPDQTSPLQSSLQPSLADSLKTKMQRSAILKDILMLENQIPFFVLSNILSSKHCSDSKLPEELSLNLLVKNFCDERSPIKTDWNSWDFDKKMPKHLLDLMYLTTISEGAAKDDNKGDRILGQYFSKVKKRMLCFLLTSLCISILVFPLLLLVYVLLIIPYRILVKVLLNVLDAFGISTSFYSEKKVLIHSVAELCNAGVKFRPSTGGTKSIRFDKGTFHLPVINMRPTSGVIMRNLVAYESLITQTDSFPFKRYSELMNAMVDTTEDVQLLKKAKIIVIDENNELNDVEILEILNGMGKSMASKDEQVDKAIHGANVYYNNATNVRMKRFLKKYVYSSWKILAVLGSFILLVLSTLQTICGFYDCPKW